MTLDLETNRFKLIQFHVASAPTATPQPKSNQWRAAALSNTSGAIPNAGVSSILTIQIGNWSGIRVLVSTDSFQTECMTGTKPELGPGICEIGGLSYGTYTIQPEGLPTSFSLTLDGVGRAIVAFWQE